MTRTLMLCFPRRPETGSSLTMNLSATAALSGLNYTLGEFQLNLSDASQFKSGVSSWNWANAAGGVYIRIYNPTNLTAVIDAYPDQCCP